ncbi:MAG: Serine-type D-Ala-D-Ala carboxypeptidase, partial [Actinomycetia bacterium]|nr:Serine-type D-Ala-D-Ala carboxypeptidase [Actinomycetes bacterium]
AYQGMIGGKNGYTVHAGQTFVGAARRNGHTIIISLMRGVVLWQNAVKLLDWGFAADGKVKPIGTLVDPVDAKKKDEGGGGALPGNPLTGKHSSRGWALIAAGAGGAVLVAGGLVLVFRRRRRPATAGGPPAGPTPSPAGPPSADLNDPAGPNDPAGLNDLGGLNDGEGEPAARVPDPEPVHEPFPPDPFPAPGKASAPEPTPVPEPETASGPAASEGSVPPWEKAANTDEASPST